MLTNYDPDWNLDDLYDAAVYDAIRYPEPDERNPNERDSLDDNQR